MSRHGGRLVAGLPPPWLSSGSSRSSSARSRAPSWWRRCRVSLQGLGEATEQPDPTEASLTLTEAGLDLLLHAGRPPRPVERERLAGMADGLDLARVSWVSGEATPEPIVTRRSPAVRLGGVPVVLPPGAFLQASAFADAALAGIIADWAQGAGTPLTCSPASAPEPGAGTLCRPGARLRGRRGIDLALRRAAAEARLAGLSVERRDLSRRPLMAGRAQGPRSGRARPAPRRRPRAGRSSSRGPIAQVIYVSCSPESFAREYACWSMAGCR